MFTQITITPMYVTDQDEAIKFYVDTLGFEVEADVDFGHMRWTTVRLPQDPTRAVMLQKIGDQTPTASADTADMLQELTERGAGSWMILGTEDCYATHKQLADLGVEIVEEPSERPYGIDMAIRDPFGNMIRVTQRA